MTELKNRVHEILPSLIGDLEDLVRIQSVSADPQRLAEVDRSAQKTTQLLTPRAWTLRSSAPTTARRRP